MNLVEKWKNRETKKKLREENEKLKFELYKKRNNIKIVTLDKMSYNKICGLDRKTVIFFLQDCDNGEELYKCMKYTYQNNIGVVQVDEAQLRKIRRIKVEHGWLDEVS